MKKLDKNKEYITSNLSEERRKELLNYMINNDFGWEPFGIEDFSNGVIRWIIDKDEWDLAYEAPASQDAIDANTLFQEIKLDKNVSYYLGDLSEEQLEEVRLEVIKEKHTLVFNSHPMPHYKEYLSWWGNLWVITRNLRNEVTNALTLFDISDKTEENILNNGQESNNEVFLKAIKETFKEHNKRVSQLLEEKQQFFYYNSKEHGPNFYTKEEVQFHNGEEWSEDIVVYTQLGSNKKFATTKERFKKFKEVWI